jgi:hypothetical protein
MIDALSERVGKLETQSDKLAGLREGTQVTFTRLMGVVFVAAALIAVFNGIVGSLFKVP